STLIASLIATVSIIAVLLTIVFYRLHGFLALGVITTIPVTLVTIWILATMFMLGVPLNIMTVTITALTVGMGVAYGIHVTHRFMEEKEEQRDVDRAMHNTIKHTGGALFGSAATTMGAFSILSFSNILLLSRFGYITAIAIGYSFLVSVFVLPALLMLREKHQKKESEIT
ncbi:MAG: MMPL family transporter, partial [Thermoplasmatota archaeon]